MGVLLFERRVDGAWRPAVRLAAEDNPGSIAHYTPDGRRQVIIFDCCGPYSTVARSRGGVDETYDDVRIIYSNGLDLLARLLPGGQHEMLIRTGKGRSYLARWTHEASP